MALWTSYSRKLKRLLLPNLGLYDKHLANLGGAELRVWTRGSTTWCYTTTTTPEPGAAMVTSTMPAWDWNAAQALGTWVDCLKPRAGYFVIWEASYRS